MASGKIAGLAAILLAGALGATGCRDHQPRRYSPDQPQVQESYAQGQAAPELKPRTLTENGYDALIGKTWSAYRTGRFDSDIEMQELERELQKEREYPKKWNDYGTYITFDQNAIYINEVDLKRGKKEEKMFHVQNKVNENGTIKLLLYKGDRSGMLADEIEIREIDGKLHLNTTRHRGEYGIYTVLKPTSKNPRDPKFIDREKKQK